MSTKIEWAGETWNPVTGCTKISPGCKHCYAERMARRQVAMGFARHERGSENNDTWIAYSNAIDSDTGKWSNEITCRYDKLSEPLHWRKPRMIFVCSMSDLFHKDIPDDFIFDVLATVTKCPQHTFMILTKRPKRLAWLWRHAKIDAYPNLWLGVSVENQQTADERIPQLLATPAALHYLSLEPLLEEVDIKHYLHGCPEAYGNPDDPSWQQTMPSLSWVIAGAETDHGARPMHADQPRRIRDDCLDADIRFFFKGWGEWAHSSQISPHCTWDRVKKFIWPDGSFSVRIGRNNTGHLLDGREWREYPE